MLDLVSGALRESAARNMMAFAPLPQAERRLAENSGSDE